MSHTEALRPSFQLQMPKGLGPNVPSLPTESIGNQTSHINEASHHGVVRTELSKMEQIIEYLKVLYR